MLRASGLELAAGARTLCRDLDLTVGAGDLWAVLGCNGSGKTTLLHALAGLLPPRAGALEFDGRALAAYQRRELARGLGVLLQREDQEFWGTLADYVKLGRYPHAPFGGDAGSDAAVAQALAAFDLAPIAAQSYATLSGGERQRARLAQLWAQQPRVLLLDEPLQHLDLRHQLQTMALIRSATRAGAGGAAVVVLHDLTFAARCDRVLMMHGDGRHEQGAADAMLEPARLEALYGCRLAVCGSGATAHVMPVI